MSSNRWFMLALLFLARTAIACQFQTVGSLGPALVGELGLDYAELGTLIGLYMLPGVVIALPGGMLGQRFGAKRLVLTGLLLMVAGGLLMGLGSTFFLLAAGRLLSGVGAVLLNVLLTKMVADWFVGHEIVTAMSILISSWPLGIALGLAIFAPVAAASGWGAVMLGTAAMALACFVLIAPFYRDPPNAPRSPSTRLSIDLTGYEWRLVSLAAAIWTAYNVGYILLVSFTPELFTARGYSLAESGWLVSLLGWVLIPAVPASGYLAERLRRPTLFMVTGFAVVALALAALPFIAAPAGVLVVIALAIGLPPGLIMALPAGVLRAESRATGMGVFYSWYYAGMAILPALAGKSRDLAGTPAAPILFSAAMMALGLVCLALFRAMKRPAVLAA
jgi:predicted MFS family arabinose efflux permease